MNRIIVYLILLVICIPLVSGVELHEISYSIGSRAVEVNHLVKTVNESRITLLTPADAYDFNVYVDGKPVPFDLGRDETHKELSVDLTREPHRIDVSYRSSSFTESGTHKYFTGNVITSQYTESLVVRLLLPEEALLARPVSSLTPPVSPHPETVSTDGRRISITWSEDALEPDDALILFVVYDEASGFWNYLLLIFVIIIVAFLSIIHVRKKHINKRVRTHGKLSHLLAQEQSIVDALAKAKGRIMWQKELQIATGFTKSRLSRTVRNMERRGLLKKIPYGTSNKIQLLSEEIKVKNEQD